MSLLNKKNLPQKKLKIICMLGIFVAVLLISNSAKSQVIYKDVIKIKPSEQMGMKLSELGNSNVSIMKNDSASKSVNAKVQGVNPRLMNFKHDSMNILNDTIPNKRLKERILNDSLQKDQGIYKK